MNVLQYCNLDESLREEESLVSHNGLDQLYTTKELESKQLKNNDSEATAFHQEHMLPIMGPDRLQEVVSYLKLEKMEDMMRPFAMPPEDFPPPSTAAGFSGYFSKSVVVLERLVNLWLFNKHDK